jgi:hypothetical protein
VLAMGQGQVACRAEAQQMLRREWAGHWVETLQGSVLLPERRQRVQWGYRTGARLVPAMGQGQLACRAEAQQMLRREWAGH